MRDAKAQADAGLSEDEQGGIHYWDSVAVNHVSFDRHLLKKKKKMERLRRRCPVYRKRYRNHLRCYFPRLWFFP